MAKLDLPSLLPESFVARFPRYDTDTGSAVFAGTYYPVTVSLASLALPEFVGVGTFPGSHLFHAGAYALFFGGSITNAADMLAYATQAAKDWYQHQASPLDTAFLGVVPYAPEGLSDHVDWEYRPGQALCRVTRPVWDPHAADIAFMAVAAGGGGGSSFRIYENGSILPLEPGANFIEGADGHLTINGVDNPGASRSDLTFDCLPDGGNYFFAGDSFTWDTNVWVYNGPSFTFNTTVITIGPTSVFVLAGYTVQVPSRFDDSTPSALFDPGTSEWWILDNTGGGFTFTGITQPAAGFRTGRFLKITNYSGARIKYPNEDAGASAQDRILTPNGCDWYAENGETTFFKYDEAQDSGVGRWLILAWMPHYQVNGSPTPEYYYQGLDLVAGSGVTLTPTTDCPNNILRVTIASSVASLTASTHVLTGGVPITTDSTWTATGETISLPSAGTYMLSYAAPAEAQANGTASSVPENIIMGKLRNTTAGSDVPGSVAIITQDDDQGGFTHSNTSGCGMLTYTVAAPSTIELYGFRSPNSAWTVANIGGTEGHISYLKIL